MDENNQNIFLVKLGNKITTLRTKQNITKVQMAFEMNTSEKYIRQIEKGEINIGVLTLLKISETLNVEIQELFEF